MGLGAEGFESIIKYRMIIYLKITPTLKPLIRPPSAHLHVSCSY